MKKEGVLVSLRAWTGDIEPFHSLEEVWIQISGVPPKWSSWRNFRQIASTLGRMVEIDWNSLFTSFFSMVRVKVACKDASKVPLKRLFEIKKNMYIIHFKVEGSGKSDGPRDDQGDEDPDGGDDNGMEELDHESESKGKRTPKRSTHNQDGAKDGHPRAGSVEGSRKVASWAALFQDSDCCRVGSSELGHYSCTKLLKEMEVLESDVEEEEQDMMQADDELVRISVEWLQRSLEEHRSDGLPEDLDGLPEYREGKGVCNIENRKMAKAEVGTGKNKKKERGPVLVEKRSIRAQ
jgi:hypothetical protein